MEDSSDTLVLLRNLFASQRLAVLATQNAGQPYGNLVAFTETDDLRHLVFVTSRNTQKYSNVTGNRKVALLVDSRRNQVSDFQTAVAVTAVGTAEEITGNEREVMVKVYVNKHPQANPARLGAIGYGEYRPVADNATEEGRQANRRVEIVIGDVR